MIAVAWWHHDLCVCTFCLRSGNFLFSQDHRSRRGSNFITARTDFSDDLVFVFRITLRTREKDNFFFENSSSKVTAKSSIFVSLNHFSLFFSFLFFHTVRTRRINKRRSVDDETPMPIMNTWTQLFVSESLAWLPLSTEFAVFILDLMLRLAIYFWVQSCAKYKLRGTNFVLSNPCFGLYRKKLNLFWPVVSAKNLWVPNRWITWKSF